MIKKTVEYVDYNGDQQTEDIYFNLTKAEITEMELSQEGGLAEHAKKIAEAKDNRELIGLFKNILVKSVGKRSQDGKGFIKNDAIREEFISSAAYSEIFMELAFNEQAAIDFMVGVVPKGLINKDDVVKLSKNA